MELYNCTNLQLYNSTMELYSTGAKLSHNRRIGQETSVGAASEAACPSQASGPLGTVGTGQQRQATRESGHLRQASRESGYLRQATRETGHLRQASRESGHLGQASRESGHLRQATRESGHLGQTSRDCPQKVLTAGLDSNSVSSSVNHSSLGQRLIRGHRCRVERSGRLQYYRIYRMAALLYTGWLP